MIPAGEQPVNPSAWTTPCTHRQGIFGPNLGDVTSLACPVLPVNDEERQQQLKSSPVQVLQWDLKHALHTFHIQAYL